MFTDKYVADNRFADIFSSEPACSRQQYYTMNTAGGIADGHAGSNGVINSALYAKKHSYPWVDVGQLKDYAKIRNQYPHTKYEYGKKYEGRKNFSFSIG